MRIQNNIAALNAHRQLGGNNTAVGKNLEKLSSGFRINRAGDDAAGLAISEKMRSQIKGLQTASKNAQDGVSLIQTAEGALTEVHSMLNRMVELATQSANGTYGEGERNKLNEEVNALKDEIDRISEGTNFNGINLLDGSLSGGGSKGTALTGAQVVTYKAAETVAKGEDTSGVTLGEETIVIDGANIKVDWSKLSADDQAALKKDWSATTGGPSKADAEKAASIMEKAINDAIDASGLGVEHITVKATGSDTAADTFVIKSGSANKDSSVNTSTASALITTLTGMDGTAAATSTATVANVSEMNGKFAMTINGKEFAIETSGITGASDLASTLKTAIDSVITNYNTAVPAGDALKATDFAVSISKDGRVQITNNSDVKIGFKDVDGGTVAKSLGISSEGKVSGQGLELQVGDTNDTFQKVTVSVESMSASSLGLTGVDISSQVSAGNSIDKINEAIEKVSTARGDLGALQNRLEHTINNLGVTTENMTAAESRIRDVDMASEMMGFTKNNILTQAAQAMLAQANQLPQGVLQLLQ